MKRTLGMALLLLALPCARAAAQSGTSPFRPVIRLKGAAAANTDTAPAPARPPIAVQPAAKAVPARSAKPVKPARKSAVAANAVAATAPAEATSPVDAAACAPAPVAEPMTPPVPPAQEPVPAPVPAPAPAPVSAPTLAPTVNGASFVVSGLVGVTLFGQDHALGFGNGQSALWAKSAEAPADAALVGADIRNTRINFAFSGGSISNGVKASGVLELDFFGGFPGASPSADEQPLPRLRLAYADLVRGNTSVRVGQFWSPLAGNVPVSASRIAFPLGLGSGGVVGWRNPGVLVQHVLSSGARRAAAQVAVFRGSWTGSDVLDQQSAGETSRLPQVEVRFDLASGVRWSAYVVGHVDGKDLNGVGKDTAHLGTLYGKAVAFGAKTVRGPLTLHGNLYTGRAIAQAMGQLAQFGDIGSTGGWAQAGYALSKPISVWVFGALDEVVEADAFRAVKGDARLRNELIAVQVQYSRGDYTAGAELIRPTTTWGHRVDGAVTKWQRSGAQLAFSVVYRFSSASAAPVVVAAASPAASK